MIILVCKGRTIMEHTINHLADLFEGILTDNDNPLCQALWKELERRGWEIEQTLKGTLR
jgi:hypothetical protein